MSAKSATNPLPTRSVSVIDHAAAGAAMRERRKKAQLSIREVGDKLGFSIAYISDLENGRKNWSEELAAKYLAALGGAK